jgi:hypothetical protein
VDLYIHSPIRLQGLVASLVKYGNNFYCYTYLGYTFKIKGTCSKTWGQCLDPEFHEAAFNFQATKNVPMGLDITNLSTYLLNFHHKDKI